MRVEGERVRVAVSGPRASEPSWSVRIAGGEPVPVPPGGEAVVPVLRARERRAVGADLVVEFRGAEILTDHAEGDPLQPISEAAGTFGPRDAPRLRLARRG